MDPIEHLEFLKTRRSRRRYTDTPVDIEKIKRALEAASWAPSGANSQPWEFVLIGPGEHREQIQDMCKQADQRFHENAQPWLKEFMEHHDIGVEKIYFDKAPWLLCVFSQRELPYWYPSVWLSICNIINQLNAEGLNTVVYTPTLTSDFNELVGVDPKWSFQTMLPVGYAEDSEEVKERPRILISKKTRIYDSKGLRDLED